MSGSDGSDGRRWRWSSRRRAGSRRRCRLALIRPGRSILADRSRAWPAALTRSRRQAGALVRLVGTGLKTKTRRCRTAHGRRRPAAAARLARRKPAADLLAQGGARGAVGAAAAAQLGARRRRVGAGRLLQRLVALALGGLELDLEAVGGGAQVVAALARGFGEGRVGEVGRILDARCGPPRP